MRLDERPRHARAADAPPVPRPAADDGRRAAKQSSATAFDTEPAGSGPTAPDRCGKRSKLEGEQATLGLYTAKDDRWTIARLTDAGRRRMAEVATDHSADWQGLGVSILHRLVMETLLDADESARAEVRPRHRGSRPRPARRATPPAATPPGQQGTGGRFELAALVMPATVEHIRAISSHGERMPAKSTYFYPEAAQRPGDQSAGVDCEPASRVVLDPDCNVNRGRGRPGSHVYSQPLLSPFHVKRLRRAGPIVHGARSACFT